MASPGVDHVKDFSALRAELIMMGQHLSGRKTRDHMTRCGDVDIKDGYGYG